VGKFPTKAAAAKVADVSVEQLNRWSAGDVKVPVDALWRLAEAANIDFCWLWSGTGSREVTVLRPAGRVLHEPALRDVLTVLARVMADGVVFGPDRFAELVLQLHDHVVQSRTGAGTDLDLSDLGTIIRLAAQAQ
jgi:hypothetical protein